MTDGTVDRRLDHLQGDQETTRNTLTSGVALSLLFKRPVDPGSYEALHRTHLIHLHPVLLPLLGENES